MAQFFVYRVTDVDAAVGHNPVGHNRRCDTFAPSFRRYLIPNAMQGKQEVAFLFEADNFAAVSGFVGTVQCQTKFPFGCGNAEKDGMALMVIGKTEFRFGCVYDDFFLLNIGVNCIRLPLCIYGGNH